jgi:hypothetical protein
LRDVRWPHCRSVPRGGERWSVNYREAGYCGCCGHWICRIAGSAVCLDRRPRSDHRDSKPRVPSVRFRSTRAHEYYLEGRLPLADRDGYSSLFLYYKLAQSPCAVGAGKLRPPLNCRHSSFRPPIQIRQIDALFILGRGAVNSTSPNNQEHLGLSPKRFLLRRRISECAVMVLRLERAHGTV